jgi:hypothetical protein
MSFEIHGFVIPIPVVGIRHFASPCVYDGYANMLPAVPVSGFADFKYIGGGFVPSATNATSDHEETNESDQGTSPLEPTH